MALTVNVTNLLFEQGWTNGSVAAQYINRSVTAVDHLAKVLPGHRVLTAAEQAAFNLNISLLDNNVTALVFNSGRGLDFRYLAPAIMGFFNSTSYTAPVLCTYAISGGYGFHPRLLYYVLLVFSLVFRRHIWLSTAALGTAMTYAATAAVHSLALLSAFKFSNSAAPQNPVEWGDADLFAIFPIVVAGCIMLTPILNWSITVRDNEARPVVAWWGLLMFASAMGCLQVLNMKDPTPVTYGSTAICQRNDLPECVNGTSWGGDEVYLASQVYYQNCECIDLCGTISVEVPMRRSTQMGPWLVSEKTTMLVKYKSGRTKLINTLALILVIFQGLLGLVESRWTQAEVRNWIFRKLSSSKWHDRFFQKLEEKNAEELPEGASAITRIYWAVTIFCGVPFLKVRTWFRRTCERRPRIGRAQKGVKMYLKRSLFFAAKWTAAAVYLFSVFMAVACPMLFISSVVMNEIYVRFYPVSEQNDAVGQWGSWVAAAFVILAAVIAKLNNQFWHIVGRCYAATVRFVRHMRGKAPPRSNKDDRNDRDNFKGDLSTLAKMCIAPVKHAYHSTIKAWVRAVNEVKEFVEWWQDPEEYSTWDWVGKDITWWDDMIEPGEFYKSWDTDVENLAYLQGSSKPLKEVLTRREPAEPRVSRSPSPKGTVVVTSNEVDVTESPISIACSPRSSRSPRENSSVDLDRSDAWDATPGFEMEDVSLLRHAEPRSDGPPDRKLT
ncbi:MAG: hypothetical protein M1833_005626 [Piccolia ochrophora]|nr:MAG: hypothetical protein M1833_005626 [Piccolia ochrophora]